MVLYTHPHTHTTHPHTHTHIHTHTHTTPHTHTTNTHTHTHTTHTHTHTYIHHLHTHIHPHTHTHTHTHTTHRLQFYKLRSILSSNIYIIFKLILPHLALVWDPEQCVSTPPVTTLSCIFQPTFRSHASRVYRTAARRIMKASTYAFCHNVTVIKGWCAWQGKGRLPLCCIEQHAINADEGVEVQLHVFLTWATHWGKWSASCPDHGEKTPVATPHDARCVPRPSPGTRIFLAPASRKSIHDSSVVQPATC